jgi:dihydrofolate reductase
MIFAVDDRGNIGNQGTLPWPHIAEDMAHFQKLTTGQVVIMGRRTWDDPKMPKPLPGRTNYVFTNRPLQVAGAIPVSGDYHENILAIEARHPDKKVFIIGGAELISKTIDIADHLHITHVRGVYRADTRIDLKVLKTFNMKTATASPHNKCSFVNYENFFRRNSTSS